MAGPRNPDDAIEPMLEENRRRFPTDAEFRRAVEEGMRISAQEAGIVGEDEEQISDLYDDYLLARGY